MKRLSWGILCFIIAIIALIVFPAMWVKWVAGGFIILYGLVFILSIILDCEETNDEDYFDGNNPIIKGNGH